MSEIINTIWSMPAEDLLAGVVNAAIVVVLAQVVAGGIAFAVLEWWSRR